ncbi:MAG TPA: EthD family reductase [Dehalococcoidales bacterium]|nr:EthD family reductase [Dehalococcoidales bacterium]
MAKKPIMNVITTRCQPQDEPRFNKWYNEVHIPMLMKFRGVKAVARYKVLDSQSPQYIAVYHFNSLDDFKAFGASPEFKAAIEEMNQSWPKGIEIVSRQQSELIQEW